MRKIPKINPDQIETLGGAPKGRLEPTANFTDLFKPFSKLFKPLFMKTAPEALIESLENREKLNTEQFNEILAKISQAISKGETYIQVDGDIPQSIEDRLVKALYVVTRSQTRNENWVKIDWSNANYPWSNANYTTDGN